MAENAELLEWPKKDKRRFLHVVYRVGDLDRTIQYVPSSRILLLFILCNRSYFSLIGSTLSALA